MEERYFMIYSSKTGVINGYYIEGTWKYEEILKRVRDSETLKEITKELWNTLIGNDLTIKINSPRLKITTIVDFENEDIEGWNVATTDIQENDYILQYEDYVNMYFEETVYKPISYEPSQIEKDIKFLAETLKTFIEPMQLPEDGQPNPALEKLQEIIDRYNT